MQLRKFIRLLTEAQKKVGPYAQVTIDTERYIHWKMDWQYDAVSDVDTDYMVNFNPESDGPFEHGQARATVIINQH